MKQLIEINYENADRPTVLGRELHEALEVKTEYRHWFKRMCEYGFSEGEDFNPVNFDRVQNEGERQVKREITDHQLTIDMAKELCMIQRNEKGKYFRQYFIEIEKAWNSPEMIMGRALQIAQRQLDTIKAENKQLTEKVEADKPKVAFADAVIGTEDSIPIGDFAKVLRQNGIKIGQNRLFAKLRELGWLIKSGASKNCPTQRGCESGYFEVEEKIFREWTGEQRLVMKTKITPKGQIYFIKKFISEKFMSDKKVTA